MTGSKRIGVLGGTFDPVHFGHLDAAGAARRALDLDHVLLMPARVPPHKASAPLASAFHRFAMAALAAADRTELRVSDLELDRSGPSYTSLTLDRLARAGHRPAQLFFIAGTDAFAEIPAWRDYPDILGRSHFVVVSRPGNAADRMPERLPALAGRMRSPAGKAPDAGADATRIWLVPARTRDVSSSDVRACVRQGRAVDGFVPATVAAHIARHDLYAGSRGEGLA
ncbi:MAG: nicotinate-nucleotide adenylyltransferase [Acidobacteria bacterium]|nr:nicotinate-nucleotide adenylyltransferase [Acidobacteriota bacterium]